MDFFLVFLTILISLILSSLFSLLPFRLSDFNNQFSINTERLAPYECGFDPFEHSRHIFDVKFYLVAILFLIFDLEVSFLFPWALTLYNQFQFWTMILFLLILTFGFVYEWKKGAIDWN